MKKALPNLTLCLATGMIGGLLLHQAARYQSSSEVWIAAFIAVVSMAAMLQLHLLRKPEPRVKSYLPLYLSAFWLAGIAATATAMMQLQLSWFWLTFPVVLLIFWMRSFQHLHSKVK